MASFDKALEKMKNETDKEKVEAHLEYLKEARQALEEAVAHYSNQELINDWTQAWYSNARDAYERKLEKVENVIKILEARSGSSVQTGTGTTPVEGIQTNPT